MMKEPVKVIAQNITQNHDAEGFVRWCSEVATEDDLDKLKAAFRVSEHRYWEELNWENRCRLLYNRILGYQHRYRKFTGNALAKAMDANKALWREYYDDYRYANPTDWLRLVLAVNDTLQQHGHEGVWGGAVTYAKVEEGYSYRTLYHDDIRAAYNEEFYSLLFGWW